MSYNSLILLLLVLVCVQQITADCKPCKCATYVSNKYLKAWCSFRQIDRVLPNVPDFLPANITYLEMNEQPLKSLTARMYVRAKLTQLQKLEHTECKIANVDKDALNGMISLKELILEQNLIQSLDPKVFSTNINLTSVHLKRNQLVTLPNGLFSNLTSLTSVDVSYNAIQSVKEYAFYNNPLLEVINLQNNQLRMIEASMVDRLKALTNLLIDNNDWNCHCGLAKLRDLMEDRNMFYRSKPTCDNPRGVRYKSWDKLTAADFKCWLNMNTPINQIKNVTLYGDSAVLPCRFSANPPLNNIQWNYQGNDTTKLDGAKYVARREFDKSTLSNSSTLTINKTTPADSGKYTCVGISDYGNITGTYYLTVITTQPARVTILSEASVELTENVENFTLPCKIFGIPKPGMRWLANEDITSIIPDNIYIISESAAETDHYWYNLTIRTIGKDQWKNYTCNGWTRAGDVSKSVSVTVKSRPRIHHISNRVSDSKERATVLCEVEAYPRPTMKWQLNGVDIDTSSLRKYEFTTLTDALDGKVNHFRAYLHISDISIPDEGTYTCVATNELGKQSAQTDVWYDHAPVIEIPTDNTVIATAISETVTLECKTSGRPSDMFWVRNGKDLTKSSGKYLLNRSYGTPAWCNLTIFDIDSPDGGTYTCVANNHLGFESKGVSLSVSGGPVSGVTIAIWIIAVLVVIMALAVFFAYFKRPQYCTQAQAVTHMPDEQVQFNMNAVS